MEWRIYALPGGIFPQGLSFCVFCGVALEVGLIYLIFSTVLTWVQRFGEKKLASYGHKEG